MNAGGPEPTSEDDEDMDIEALKIGALGIAEKVVKELRGSQESQYLAGGGYNGEY